ncbi:hypothetical protein ACFRDV_27325 [Streptomyces fagopyri]
MDLGYPVERAEEVAAAAGVLEEGQCGLGDGQSVSGPQSHRGLVVD